MGKGIRPFYNLFSTVSFNHLSLGASYSLRIRATDSPSQEPPLSGTADLLIYVTSNDILSTHFEYGLVSNVITRENATSYKVPISFLTADKAATLHASFDTAQAVGDIQLNPTTLTPTDFRYLLLQNELYHEDKLLTIVFRAEDSRYYHRNTGK